MHEDGYIKLADFGTAKNLGNKTVKNYFILKLKII
jgi:serine/threonine protein kinase